jgi:hypothetical protein
MLARLHRAGELRAIYIPDATDGAMRDLVRARADASASARRPNIASRRSCCDRGVAIRGARDGRYRTAGG